MRISVLVFTVALLAFALAPAAAQSTAAAAGPRMPDGKPDFSGFWSSPAKPGSTGGGNNFTKEKFPPFKPGGEALFYEPRTGNPRHDDPRAFCMPSGFPTGFFAPYAIQMVQSKDYLVMVQEFERSTRLIPLDGRQHLKGIEPTFYGESVGHWEGDTLVIDSANFKRWALDDYHYVNPKEYRMHSDDFHVIERLRRTDANTIEYKMTVDDPKIFTAPWTEDLEMKYHPEWAKVGLYEFVCQENNRCAGGHCEGN